ncbi:E3 ubiquitin-protein ligase ATL4-like [Andrographis paniculata]|uniref:E3 ubiquitin-protein ligase ATL4-like n=1 Tax=Andrographis paniculata TaxID=175694 RepID=UPI0021E8B1F6|nr:E3 ubiquitin-protein ligase ATL4-like [Andrographis paniculata]
MSNPFPPPLSAVVGGGDVTPQQIPLLPPPNTDSFSSSSSESAASSSAAPPVSAIIVIIVIASAVTVAVAVYLLRHISRRFSNTYRDDAVSLPSGSPNVNGNRPMRHVAPSGMLDSLPVFTFRSVNGNLAGGDCAVCLCKFEADDQLRLLPLCCHAFHASCIDAWIVSNLTCPLCRSAVLCSDADLLRKIDSGENGNRSGGSFRIEIGSISRHGGGGAAEAAEGDRRSYSIGGSFEYILDENGYEIPAGSTVHRRGTSDCTSLDKESSVGIPTPQPPGEILAAEVAGGRNWLRELTSRSFSSRTMSLRSSGRFFAGSSRRSEHLAAAPEDVEANRVGEEISEFFRWLSGV